MRNILRRKEEDPSGPWDGQEAHEGAKGGAVLPPQNWLVPLLLLCLRDGGSYSHQLKEKIGELGFDGVVPGEMYQVLWRMEREGKVACDRGGGGYRIPRRWYEITEAGEAHLRYWADSLARDQEGSELFFRLYDKISTRGRGRG